MSDLKISGGGRTDVMFTITPVPLEFVFYSQGVENKECGKFTFDELKKDWVFKGNADKSAKLFVEAVCRNLPSEK